MALEPLTAILGYGPAVLACALAGWLLWRMHPNAGPPPRRLLVPALVLLALVLLVLGAAVCVQRQGLWPGLLVAGFSLSLGGVLGPYLQAGWRLWRGPQPPAPGIEGRD